MRKYAILLIMCICFWSSDSHAFFGRAWTWKEIGFAGLSIVGAYADYSTTRHNLALGTNHIEMNPILGDRPGSSELKVYFSISAILTIIAADYWDNHRKEILIGKTAINTSLAIHNYRKNR